MGSLSRHLTSLHGTFISKLILSHPEGGTVRLNVILTLVCPLTQV